MRFCLSNFKDFKNILITAELILTEIKFEVDNDGLRFRGMSGGNTSFFYADFKRDYFDEYEIDVPENITIDASELLKVIKRIKNDDDVCVTIGDLSLDIKVNGKKTFKINALDEDYDSPNLPYMEYPVNTSVDFDDFKDSITDSKLYGDSFTIESTDGALVISSDGVLGEYSSELLVGDEIKSGCRSVFNSDLMASFFKLSNLSDMLNVHMGTDYPIYLDINDEFDELDVKLLVAPRIEER